MERNANYALVGLISAILFGALLVFAVWLAGAGFNRNTVVYDILFKGPVRGVSEGAEVHFNGIKVGDVSRIYLDPANSTLVIAEVKLSSDVPVRTDSIATLEPQGITGVNYIQISAGSPKAPLLRTATPAGQTPVIHTRTDALSNLLTGGGDLIQRSVVALDRVNQVLSEKNIAKVSATLGHVDNVTAELDRRKAIIGDAQKMVQDADAALVQVRELAKTSNGVVGQDGKRALGRLGDAAGQIEAAAKSLRGMIDDMKGPTHDFAAAGLPQMTSAMASLQRATEHMDQVLSEIENNPRGFISKPPARQVEVKP